MIMLTEFDKQEGNNEDRTRVSYKKMRIMILIILSVKK